jgi:hypothetical protein
VLASTSSEYVVSGLGLALDHEFCARMGGGISLETAPGQGSRLTIRIPATLAVEDDNEASGVPHASGAARRPREVPHDVASIGRAGRRTQAVRAVEARCQVGAGGSLPVPWGEARTATGPKPPAFAAPDSAQCGRRQIAAPPFDRLKVAFLRDLILNGHLRAVDIKAPRAASQTLGSTDRGSGGQVDLERHDDREEQQAAHRR